MDQPGKVANPARGQLNRENNIPLSPCVPDNLVSRDGFRRIMMLHWLDKMTFFCLYSTISHLALGPIICH